MLNLVLYRGKVSVLLSAVSWETVVSVDCGVILVLEYSAVLIVQICIDNSDSA